MTDRQEPGAEGSPGSGHRQQEPAPPAYPPFGPPSHPPQGHPEKGRWKLLTSAATAVLVAGTGILIGVSLGSEQAEGQVKQVPPAEAASPLPETPSAGLDPDPSVCGLAGFETEGRLISSAPEASWSYQGGLGYPASPTAGPAMTAPSGYRYCFQHTPEGAVFAAANAMVNGTTDDPGMMGAWLDYVLADGRYRDELVQTNSTPDPPESSGGVSIVGFRLLSYTAREARVELAYIATGGFTYLYGAVAYTLVWQDGDWLLGTDSEDTIQYRRIYDRSGFVAWADPAKVTRYTMPPRPEGTP